MKGIMMTNQKLQKVLSYLKKHGSGSKLDIRSRTFYDNVGDAILKLRRRGHDIVTTWEITSTGARYAVYNYRGMVA